MRQRIFYLLTLVMLLASIWLVVRLVAWVKDPKPTFYGNYLQLSYQYDSLLGYKPVADTLMHSIKIGNADTVYDAYYHIDHFARRVASNQPNDTLNKKHLLFFGCSFTFGEGLNDSLTIPYLAGERMRGYQPYNFGYPGYGPQQMLVSLQAANGMQGVAHQQGTAIYILMPEHIYRTIGAMYVCTHWGSRMPYYQLVGDSVVRHGNFTSGRPLKALYYRFMGFTGLAAFTEPPPVKQKDIDLTVAVIATAKKTYLQRYPGSSFYVMMYPSVWYQAIGQKLVDQLRAKGIEVLDYRNIFPLDSSHYIVGDGHPTGLANKAIATQLTNDLAR